MPSRPTEPCPRPPRGCERTVLAEDRDVDPTVAVPRDSLRAELTDTGGNTLTRTIVNACRTQ
ncbi:hypothetical protein ACFCZY_12500 [Streptomyces sp. NPDC056237]|uniref:hypothetical protein n=1 Tax=Streptomyces sp. NPDC056237 TaxID=3345758 RepID=UPI0035D5AB67